jgi:hypothetical protein
MLDNRFAVVNMFTTYANALKKVIKSLNASCTFLSSTWTIIE